MPRKKKVEEDVVQAAEEVEGDAVEASPSSTTKAAAPAKPKKAFRGADSSAVMKAFFARDEIKATAKKYSSGGSKIITEGREAKAKKVNRISSGIFPIDLALGGGWVVGGVHTLIGHKSACKSTTLMKTIGEAQKLCANCWAQQDACECDNPRVPLILYIDVENCIDAKWASKHCDLEGMVISVPEYAEQALAIAEAALRTKSCDILILDSLAFLTPQKEIEEAIEKDLVGQQARVIGKGIRKILAARNEETASEGRMTTVFFTNQIRMKVGVMFGNPETTPGGLAPGFMDWSEIIMRGGKYKMDENEERPLFADFGFKTEKNKTGVPKIAYSFRLMLSNTQEHSIGEVSDESFIAEHAERLGLVTGGGASWKCLDGQFRKKSEIEDRIRTDPEFAGKLKELIIEANSS